MSLEVLDLDLNAKSRATQYLCLWILFWIEETYQTRDKRKK